MKLLFDNLFFLGQAMSLIGLVVGAGLVLREALIHTLCPSHKSVRFAALLAACVWQPLRRAVRA